MSWRNSRFGETLCRGGDFFVIQVLNAFHTIHAVCVCACVCAWQGAVDRFAVLHPTK
jgi:hypothetical protein